MNLSNDISFDVGTGPLEPNAEITETGRVSLGVYFKPERFEAEREAFGRVWLNIAEAAEIPNAGDWIVRDVVIRSSSILIVRGKDNQIRAFHNVCSHRGMKLVWERSGRGGKFACPYHAWMFDSVGDLVNIPDEGCFKHVDKQDSGLTPVACDVWEGMIFINLDPNPKTTLHDFLGPLVERVKDLPFASYPYTARVGSMIDANWKLVVEAQCEAYHVRALHTRTVAAVLSSKDNPFAHPIAFERLGAHCMSSVPRNPDFAAPGKNLVQRFSFANALQMVIAETGTNVSDYPTFVEHPDVNKHDAPLWGNDQYIVYPHLIFHVSMGGWWLHRFWPVAANKTYWEAVYHFEQPKSLRTVFATQYSLSLNRDTLMEDNLANMQQQQIMESGARPFAQFGDQEIACVHMAAVSHAVTESLALLSPSPEMAIAAE